jgi:hypothetical protein
MLRIVLTSISHFILNREYGIPIDRIIIDSYAQHSTTNLRNAARFMMKMGLKKSIIVTDHLQSFYYSHDVLSTFRRRCRKELGYACGGKAVLQLSNY